MIVVTEKELSDQKQKKKRPSVGNSDEVKAAQAAQAQAQGIDIERKVSHGIGGYGNIRRPSDVAFPPKPSNNNSLWSRISSISPGTSPTDKKETVFNNPFRKSNVSEAEAEAPLMEDDDLGHREGMARRGSQR